MPVYKNETETTIVESFKNENGSLISYRIEPEESLATVYLLTNANLTKISDAPYYNPLQTTTQTVTSTGLADPKTIEIDLNTKILSIINQSAVLVTLFLQSTANTPGINCYPNTERVINVGHNVDQIILQFAAAATVYVEQRK